jgi:hypothetical protein
MPRILLAGQCLLRIAWAAGMVINVACGPMAYKTQLLAQYQLCRKQILVFFMEMISTKNVK